MTTKFICNGPRRFVKAQRAALEQRILETKQKLAATPKASKAPLTRKLEELQAEIKGFKGLPDEDYLGRAGCGAELTQQIEAVPDDGEVYEYQCPKCGNTGTVRKAAPEAA